MVSPASRQRCITLQQRDVVDLETPEHLRARSVVSVDVTYLQSALCSSSNNDRAVCVSRVIGAAVLACDRSRLVTAN